MDNCKYFYIYINFIQANQSRDSLARALYMRTLNAVIKRANSSRRPNHSFSPSTSSTESNGQGKAKLMTLFTMWIYDVVWLFARWLTIAAKSK